MSLNWNRAARKKKSVCDRWSILAIDETHTRYTLRCVSRLRVSRQAFVGRREITFNDTKRSWLGSWPSERKPVLGVTTGGDRIADQRDIPMDARVLTRLGTREAFLRFRGRAPMLEPCLTDREISQTRTLRRTGYPCVLGSE